MFEKRARAQQVGAHVSTICKQRLQKEQATEHPEVR